MGLGKIESVNLTDLEKTTMTLTQQRLKIYDKSLVEEGLQKGRLLATRELSQKMLALGLSISQVAQITGLDESELKQRI